MKTLQKITTTRNWKVSYNPYTDLFQLFSDKVFYMSDDLLKKERKGKAKLFFDKQTHELLLVELANGYKSIGDIDNMPKRDIISRVMEYIK